MMKPEKQNSSFNYKLTKLFLDNNRLAILCLILLLILGIIATLVLKTTGFPNPEIKVDVVQTVYPGASSETVARDVTTPLEGALKNVDGVKSYTSTSSNSFSSIAITIDNNANADSVKNRIDSAIKSVSLPATADAPKTFTPQVSGPDFIFSIASNDLKQVYDTYSKAKKDLSQMEETASIDPIVDLKQKIVVSVDENKARANGIGIDDIKAQLRSFGESLPVISNATLDAQSKTIITTLSGSSVEDIKNIVINGVTLSSVANVDIEYIFDNGVKTSYAYNLNNKGTVVPAVVFGVKSSIGSDLSKFTQKLHDKFKTYQQVEFVKFKDKIPALTDKTLFVESYAQNNFNQQQVHDVVGGLIGGPLDTDSPLKWAGLVFGGIQLVFLVMVAFVSWRAAIVAAIAIPLSLMFSNIYVFFTGNDLNTLVLFTLVLVIGLVVDPALVILESIQRKIDAGLRGQEAALAAVKDVGNGLFLAALTSVIVFIPFGVISGILGKIFSYIPLTAIPAIVASYIVPLVFLAWIGGLFLKPTRNKTKDEVQNLWRIAKWVMKTNYKILMGSRLVRIIIIILAIIVPFFVAGYYFGNGEVKMVQFASDDNGQYMIVTGQFLPSVSKEDKDAVSKSALSIITSNKYVESAYPETQGFTYFVNLKDAKDRKNIKSVKIAQEIETQLQSEFGAKFFDLKSGLLQNGPPTGNYQVQIGIKTDNLEKLKTASLEVGKVMQNICLKNKQISIDEACKGGTKIVTKVDDGFTNKENKVVEVLIDRNKLAEKQLEIPNAPLSIIVNENIKQLFNDDTSKKVGTLNINGDDIEIVLKKDSPNPATVDEIKNILMFGTKGQIVKLSDIATVTEKTPKVSIQRVKGQTVGVVQARLQSGNDDQGTAVLVANTLINNYKDNDYKLTKDLGLENGAIDQYSEGGTSEFAKSFSELFIALILAIVLTYIVLSLFFRSFTQPLVILFTVPLTFLGIFPALAYLGGGQFGFLEIIGMIILVGIVENVAIFLIDAAHQKEDLEGMDYKNAISMAAGLRFRPVILTKLTAMASLLPLALFSELYRSISIVIMFGLLTSGFTSLFTTPILYIFFRWLSEKYRTTRWWNKILFFLAFPIYIIYWAIKDKPISFLKKK